MNLCELLKTLGLNFKVKDAKVSLITENIEDVTSESIFVCVSGRNFNGHIHAVDALEKGAVLVIGEEDIEHERYCRVSDSRVVMSYLCSAFFGFPAEKIKLIGITGTNGKTTTAEYIRHIISYSGKKCGVIGTLGCDSGDGIKNADGHTTPDSFKFFSELRSMVENGCEYCVAEISSQALRQNRVDAAQFTLGVFTNLGHDHLDYHKTIEDYIDAKKKLFSLSCMCLVNADDAYRDCFAAAAENKPCAFYSAGINLSDFSARNIRYVSGGSTYLLFDGKAIERVTVNSPGKIGVYNSLCAASACFMLGFSMKDVSEALRNLPEVCGRLQFIHSDSGFDVCIDFAHTPEALASALTAVRSVCKGKLIVVFGCGGNRDKTKRPVMGKTASALCDTVILTSDNPRFEEPEKIIDDIISGIKKKTAVFREADRKKAIELAVKKANSGDVVLIAGKGHEKTQTVNGAEYPFSDEDVVKALLDITTEKVAINS